MTGRSAITVKGVAWDDADDWTLELAHDYENCELVSESLPFRMPAWTLVKKTNVDFDKEIHYDRNDVIPGLPINGISDDATSVVPTSPRIDPGRGSFTPPGSSAGSVHSGRGSS